MIKDGKKMATLHQLFEGQVKARPDSIAVSSERKSINYRELNERANKLAHLLRARYFDLYGKHLQKDTLIGVFLERSVEAIVSILAILKAGAAYVPLDPDCPDVRLNYLLEDSQVKLIVTHSGLRDLLNEPPEKLITIDDKTHTQASKENPQNINTPND